MKKVRDVRIYKNYFTDFYGTLPDKVKGKVDEVLFMVTVADRIPLKFFKHIETTKGLYEISIEWGGNIYRVFCCFDAGNLIILFNGFQKKSQKTPYNEIERATRIKANYFEEKTK
jgi:phage-related protein